MADVIRDAIVTTLAAIPDIGKVHGYQRYSARAKDLVDVYAYKGQLRGWFVRRFSVVDKDVSLGSRRETTHWYIRGYMAIDDANQSELAFDALLDAIRAAFRAEWLPTNLGSTVIHRIYNEQMDISIDETGPVMFAGVLCHSARCSLIIWNHVTYL